MTKIDDVKNGLLMPEIQIVETPRQIHSLTARSLSREFREGLRQIPDKVVSPPVSRSLMGKQPTILREVMRLKDKDNDTAMILPGKLKSNIIFWEQIQKQN